ALPVLGEAKRRAQKGQPIGAAQMDRRHGAAFIPLEARLVIECIDVRETAREKDEKEILSLRRMMRGARRGDLGVVDLSRPAQRAVQAQTAKAAGAAAEEGATG